MLKSTTEYLTDDRNPTGYSQVLTETAFDANGAVSKKTIYSVGHDQISQTVYDYSASSQQPTVTSQFFGTDGHGSVRVLVDAVAAIVRDQRDENRVICIRRQPSHLKDAGYEFSRSLPKDQLASS